MKHTIKSSTVHNSSTKEQIKSLIIETLHKGSHIDRKIDGSNTLLHLAVEKDLKDCVVKLLSSGANSNILNLNGHSAKDIALLNGNQILLQVLGRREDYGNHLLMVDPQSTSELSLKTSRDNDGNNSDTRLLPLRIGAVYEDYLDWSDSKRCQRLKELIESLKSEGVLLNNEIHALCDRKTKTIANLQHIHNKLRDKEHHHCLKVYEMIQVERSCRHDLSKVSEEVSRLKLSVEESQSREHWRGAVRVRRRPGGMFAGWGSNQWHDCQVVITGEGFVFDCDVLSRDKKKLAAVNDAMSDLSPSASSFVTLSSGPIRRRLNKQNTAAPASSLLIDERSLSWESIVRVEISPGDLTVRHKLGVLDMDVTYLSSEVRSSSRSASPVRMAERDSPSFGSDEIVNLRFVSAGDDGDTSLNKSRYAADLEVVVRVIKLLGCNVRSDSTTHCDDDDGDGFGLSSQSLSRHFAQEFLGEEVSSEDDAALSVAIPIRHRATFSNSAERSPTHGSRPGAAPRDSSSGLTSVESLLHSAARGTSRSSISGSSYSTRPSLNSSGHTVQIIGECDAHPGRPQSGSDWVGSHKIEASAKKTAAGQLDITPISISAVSARDSFSQGKVRLSEDWKRSPDNFTRRKRNSVDGSAHTDTSLSAMRRSSTCGDRGRRDERSSLSEQLHCLRGLYRDDLAQSGSGSESSSPRASHQPKHRDLRSLKQLLNALRGERDSLQQRLVEVITAREKLLEKFHFLQALRAVVDDPPRAPTRTLSSAKTPSVEKAMQMLAVYREHVDGASGSATPVSMQSGSSSSQLSEAEDFVKIMLRDGHMMDHLAFDSEGVTAQQPHTKERTESVDSVSLWQAQSTSRAISTNSSKIEQQLVYGSNLRQCDVSMSMNSTAGLFTSGSSFLSPEAPSHSSSSSWRQQRGDIQSPFADALVEAARSPSTTSPLVNSSTSSLGMPFTPPSFKKPQETVSIESTSARMRPPNSTGSIRTSPWKLYSSKRPLQQKPHTASDLTALSSPTRSASAASSSAHIFGAPPAEFQSDFDEVMRQLEEVWNCELESFETVGRLAQCLVLREQTYTRLSRLKIQERAMVVPQQEVLYDVEF